MSPESLAVTQWVAELRHAEPGRYGFTDPDTGSVLWARVSLSSEKVSVIVQ